MSILNVNQIQPVGSGQTVTISAANITASSSTISASSFVGPLTGDIPVLKKLYPWFSPQGRVIDTLVLLGSSNNKSKKGKS